MQIERLIKLIFYLVRHKRVTAKELAEYLGVSTRTIYRDITTVSLAGIPILSKKGFGGGLSLMDGFTLDESFLTSDEKMYVYQGLQILNAANYPETEHVLNKIGALFNQPPTEEWLEIDFSYWGSEETEKVTLSELRKAITEKHLLTFDYFNSELTSSKRNVEPLRLLFKSHAWYIVGFCHYSQAIRIFRLSRMKKIIVLSETFERSLPNDFSLSIRKDDTEWINFTLLFSKKIAHRLFDEFHEHQVQQLSNDGYLVNVQYPLSEWTYLRLLSYGPYVEVLEPKEAREELRMRALKITKIYE